MTPWPFLFKTNEQIENAEPIVGWKYEPRLTKYDNIIYHEPYFSNYLKSEKMHILDDWAKGYNIEPVIPNPYINIKYPYKYELSEPLTKSYCVVQVNGGALQGGEYKINPRDYRLDLVQKLIRKIQLQMDLEVVCFRYGYGTARGYSSTCAAIGVNGSTSWTQLVPSGFSVTTWLYYEEETNA